MARSLLQGHGRRGSLPHLGKESCKVDQILKSKSGPCCADREVRVRRGEARPGHRHSHSVTLRVAIEDPTLTPLDAVGEHVQLLPTQRVKGMGNADRVGHFAGVRCS